MIAIYFLHVSTKISKPFYIYGNSKLWYDNRKLLIMLLALRFMILFYKVTITCMHCSCKDIRKRSRACSLLFFSFPMLFRDNIPTVLQGLTFFFLSAVWYARHRFSINSLYNSCSVHRYIFSLGNQHINNRQ